MTKLDRQIRKLIRMLVDRNVSAIYPSEVAHLLQCTEEAVLDVLYDLDAEEILKYSYELHCCECGEVMSVFEDPKLLTSAPFPCPGCCAQTESINMNETVIAFYPLNDPQKLSKCSVV